LTLEKASSAGGAKNGRLGPAKPPIIEVIQLLENFVAEPIA